MSVMFFVSVDNELNKMFLSKKKQFSCKKINITNTKICTFAMYCVELNTTLIDL